MSLRRVSKQKAANVFSAKQLQREGQFFCMCNKNFKDLSGEVFVDSIPWLEYHPAHRWFVFCSKECHEKWSEEKKPGLERKDEALRSQNRWLKIASMTPLSGGFRWS